MKLLAVALLVASLLVILLTSGVVNAKRHYPRPTQTPIPTIRPTPTIAPTPTPDSTYTFSEEFNTTGLDTTKWRHNYSCCGSTTMDRTLSTQPGDGYLHQKVVNRNGVWYADILDTKGSFTQTYGYFEARMKIPKGKGIWPAFWLYNGTFGTDGDEIDIQEICANLVGQNGGNDVSFLHQTVHKGTQSNQVYNTNGRVGDLSLDWHVYAVDWRPTYIAFYLDGAQMWRETSMLISTSKAVLLNLGVGGSWCSAPDSTTPSGSEMLTDWVHVKQ